MHPGAVWGQLWPWVTCPPTGLDGLGCHVVQHQRPSAVRLYLSRCCLSWAGVTRPGGNSKDGVKMLHPPGASAVSTDRPRADPPQCEPVLARPPGPGWSCFLLRPLPCIPRPEAGRLGSYGGWQGPAHQPIPSEARPHSSPGQPGPDPRQVLLQPPLADSAPTQKAGQGRGCSLPALGSWALPVVTA